MSNSISINEFTKFAAGKKMNFSQTCNLLSQFVKEKRALNHNLDASPPLGTSSSSEGYDRSTMNLFPLKQTQQDSNGFSVGRTINLFPQISGFNSSMNKRAIPEPPVEQMTIFYGGQVVVFNDLPSDKATEVINLASNFESSLKKRKVETPASPIPTLVSGPISNAKPIVSQNLSSSLVPNPSQPKSHMPAQAHLPSPDLPIARKASLHRFLEKRKERLVAKAPPSLNVADGGETKPVEGKAWLGLNSLPVFQNQQQQ